MWRKTLGCVLFWARICVLAPLLPVAIFIDICLELHYRGILAITVAFVCGYTCAYLTYNAEALPEETTTVGFPVKQTLLFRAIQWAFGSEAVWMILYTLRWCVQRVRSMIAMIRALEWFLVVVEKLLVY